MDKNELPLSVSVSCTKLYRVFLVSDLTVENTVQGRMTVLDKGNPEKRM